MPVNGLARLDQEEWLLCGGDALENGVLKHLGRVALEEEDHSRHLANRVAEFGRFGIDQPGDGVDDGVWFLGLIHAFLGGCADLFAVCVVVGNLFARSGV